MRPLGVPFYAVNHLGGHLAADVYEHGPLPECVALLVSGGHTHLLHVRSLGEPMVELGATVDDAAGEAYDKVARLLGLGYPGGKVLDDLARSGDPDAIVFPRGMTGPSDDPCAFSFSGLKTAVACYVEAHPDFRPADVAAGFQEAVADVLTRKAVRAATGLGVSTLLIAGGVAANSRLRELATQRCSEAGLTLRIPRPRLCTDNGAMIAAFAAHLVAAKAAPSPLDVPSDPGLPVVKGQVADPGAAAAAVRNTPWANRHARSTGAPLSASTLMYRVLGGSRTTPAPAPATTTRGHGRMPNHLIIRTVRGAPERPKTPVRANSPGSESR